MSCDCPIGTCKEFGFTGRRADICAGHVLTPEKCEAYRKSWRKQLPSAGKQVSNCTQAMARWIAEGRPKRTDEQVDEILAICEPCEHFTGSRCKLCGCWLRAKAKMATESCPDGRW